MQKNSRECFALLNAFPYFLLQKERSSTRNAIPYFLLQKEPTIILFAQAAILVVPKTAWE